MPKPKKRRTLRRKLGERRYKKIFIISVEGAITEKDYFKILNSLQSNVIKTIQHNCKNAPKYVLKRMKAYLKEEVLKKNDEAWIVVDKDAWTEDQLQELFIWSKNAENYGFALSNPNFEHWLLLHFEKGEGISSTQQCTQRLKKYLPDYNKSLSSVKINKEQIKKAINLAKACDNPHCVDWPRDFGVTTVYKLVEKVLSEVFD